MSSDQMLIKLLSLFIFILTMAFISMLSHTSHDILGKIQIFLFFSTFMLNNYYIINIKLLMTSITFLLKLLPTRFMCQKCSRNWKDLGVKLAEHPLQHLPVDLVLPVSPLPELVLARAEFDVKINVNNYVIESFV